MLAITIHISEALAGNTLAQAIKQTAPAESWNSVKRLIASRRVQVNGNLCVDEGRRLASGDVVKVTAEAGSRPITARDIKLVHVDRHVVVVDKPAGVTTERHAEEKTWPARRKQLQPTLDEWIATLLAEERRPPKGARAGASSRHRDDSAPVEPVFAVHRLDRDTSGLMVFARSREAELGLVQQFRKHTVTRRYVAIVHGDPGERTIESDFVRDRGDGLRGSLPAGSPPNEASQHAVTHVRPIEQLGPYTVIECRLQTGRTHQIRIHLSELGHMLCGEKTYTHMPGGKPQIDNSRAPRQALHAVELGFVHPTTGERLQFISGLPDDLRNLLKRLQAQT
jgi:23S rRNA pseudouridine1911/1915/1917 synthase